MVVDDRVNKRPAPQRRSGPDHTNDEEITGSLTPVFP
jgi:hypothetical protein